MTPEDGPSREVLAAQISALKAVVKRQQRYIESMRASHFWKLRDAYFAFRRRFGNGIEPLLPPAAADLALEEGAIGDPYQLFRIRSRRSITEVDLLRRLAGSLTFCDPIEVLVDARAAAAHDIDATLASLKEQIYPFHRVRVLAEPDEAFAFDPQLFVCVVDAGDVLEPDALLSLAAEFKDGADVVYSDEDWLDDAGIPRDPSFKPDWSPETALTRAYVGRLCAIRGSVLAAVGGIDAAHGPSLWYDALLRISETSDRVAHVARILVHRRYGGASLSAADIEPAVRRALTRRGENADLRLTPVGINVQYAVPGDERVTVVIPTRDRADLLECCLRSLFERTTHPNFDVIVVDNGSRETETRMLLDLWSARAPGRFRVVEDGEPFNYSRLNNRAVSETDAPYIVMLNNDTEVISAEWMSAMLGQARRSHIGAVGALLLYEDGTVQHAGVVLGNVLSLAGHAYRFLDPEREAENARLTLDTNYLAVTGACLMLARRKYQEVGGLDETLAISYNDIDLCLKLYVAGYRNVLVPRARLYHYESKSRGRDDTKSKAALTLSEREVVRARWPQFAHRDPFYNPNFTRDNEDFSVNA